MKNISENVYQNDYENSSLASPLEKNLRREQYSKLGKLSALLEGRMIRVITMNNIVQKKYLSIFTRKSLSQVMKKPEPKIYKCNICEKDYPTPQTFASHFKKHNRDARVQAEREKINKKQDENIKDRIEQKSSDASELENNLS